VANQRGAKVTKAVKPVVAGTITAPFKRAVQSHNGPLSGYIKTLIIDPTSPIHALISDPLPMGTVFEQQSIDDAILSLPSPSPSVSSLSSSSSTPPALHNSQPSVDCIPTSLRTDFDLHVSMRAFAVLEAVQAQYARFMGLFFNSTHSWMTIVRKQRFIKRVASSKHKAEAEVAILLLSMRLIAEPFDFAKTRGDASRDTLYQAAKQLHAIIQTSKGPSLELIQAGIMIALFEHNSALDEAAYETLINCSDMSQCIGMGISQDSTKVRISSVTAMEEERRRTYWGIVILERYVVLEFRVF
jgi:hypothetical protein